MNQPHRTPLQRLATAFFYRACHWPPDESNGFRVRRIVCNDEWYYRFKQVQGWAFYAMEDCGENAFGVGWVIFERDVLQSTE